MRQFQLFVLLAALLASACASVPSPRTATLAITDITVIDPESRRVLPHRDVYLEGGHILAIAPSGSAALVARQSIPGSGKFLIPGLMDMHVHLFLPENPGPQFALMLTNGVTGYREMSSDCWSVLGAKMGCIEDYRALQALVESGALPGPDLLSTTSTMVMGPTRLALPKGADPFVAPTTPDQARRLVQYLASRGVDRIKTHDSIPMEAFFTIMEEARTLGLEVSGHVPFGAGSLGAAQAGYGSIEHARDLLYDCSTYGSIFRKVSADHAAGRPGSERPANLVRLQRTVEGYDPTLCASFLRKLARTGVYYVPTHVTREMEARAADPTYAKNPLRRFIDPARDANWQADLNETAALPAEERAALVSFFRHGLMITRRAFEAGIPIMAGTDASDTMIVPGFSLHRELTLFREAGLEPMDVLRTATAVPADFLRRRGRIGTIARRAEADLVVLTANPLEDIGNLSRIEAVFADGRYYDRAALDRLLAQAARSPRP